MTSLLDRLRADHRNFAFLVKSVEAALKRMFAMRIFMRSRHVERKENDAVLAEVGMTRLQMDSMYKTMALAAYEDRFVIPSSHREYAENAYDLRGSCGFSFGNGCSDGISKPSLFGNRKNSVPVDLSQLHARKKTG